MDFHILQHLLFFYMRVKEQESYKCQRSKGQCYEKVFWNLAALYLRGSYSCCSLQAGWWPIQCPRCLMPSLTPLLTLCISLNSSSKPLWQSHPSFILCFPHIIPTVWSRYFLLDYVVFCFLFCLMTVFFSYQLIPLCISYAYLAEKTYGISC